MPKPDVGSFDDVSGSSHVAPCPACARRHQFAFLALALFPAAVLLLLTRAARAYPVMRVADAMTVRASGGEMSVRLGDTARYSVDQKHAIENRGKITASARSESAPKCGRDFAQGLRLKTPKRNLRRLR